MCTCRDFTICCIFCFVIFSSPGVIIVTLSYVGVKPRFYIQEVYIPALNNSHSFNASNLNISIFIDLKFKRVQAFVPIRYQDVNITLYYTPNTTSSVGSGIVPGFGQGKKKTARRKVGVEAPGLPWEDALQKVSGGSTVALTVELATKYSLERCYEDGCDYTDPKTVVVAAEVQLDASGRKVSEKPTRLH